MPKKKQCESTETHQAHTWAEPKRGLFQCYGFMDAEDTARNLILYGFEDDAVDRLLDTLTEEIEKRVRRSIVSSLDTWAREVGQSRGETYADTVADELAVMIEKGEL